MSTYTARATREDGWWTVTVDEVEGLYTQAQRLDQIERNVRDALTLFPDIEPHPDTAHVTICPQGEHSSIF